MGNQSSISRRDNRIVLVKSILIALCAIGVLVLLIYCELSNPILGMGVMLITPIKAGLGLFFGIALFSSLSYKVIRTRTVFSPYLTAVVAILFGVTALLITTLIFRPLFAVDSSAWETSRYIAAFITMAAFAFGIYLCQRQAGEGPTKVRFVSSLAVSIAALSAIFYSTEIFFHPLKSPNPHRRLAWVQSRLPWHFTQAEKYLKSSERIRADIGEIHDIHPTLNGKNCARGGAGDWIAYFTLDVSGPKGKGTVSIKVFSGNPSEGVLKAEWTFGGSTMKLYDRNEPEPDNDAK